ncbi:TetR family transcriptional regulator [Pseudonocardia xinjiangensis]|uniref:TetR/AcrR family transcriptional regulator n=1 Tax=Pseudonocardia xinjiangensis TaxID=75289 RepID=UPI003D9026BB
MGTDGAPFRRARRPEHKQQRYEAILAAARSQAERKGVSNVSLADIAAEVGVHKSALLRYFETREEIYLHLTAEGWQDWVDGMRDELAQLPVGSVTGVAEVVARTLAARPLLCDLMTHTSLTLERNVSLEAVRNFKLAALAALADAEVLIRRVLPDLTDDDVRDLVGAVSAVAAGLWQATHPPATLVALYAEDPRLEHTRLEFTPSLQHLIEVVLTGLLHPRDGGGAPRPD